MRYAVRCAASCLLSALTILGLSCSAEDTPPQNVDAAQQRLLANRTTRASDDAQRAVTPPADCAVPSDAQTYLVIAPDPIIACGATGGIARLCWQSNVAHAEVHVGSPSGILFASGVSGTHVTGRWVADGMKFFLQDRTNDAPLDAAHTLAMRVAHVKRIDCRAR